jgi:hypothetical protein
LSLKSLAVCIEPPKSFALLIRYDTHRGAATSFSWAWDCSGVSVTVAADEPPKSFALFNGGAYFFFKYSHPQRHSGWLHGAQVLVLYWMRAVMALASGLSLY